MQYIIDEALSLGLVTSKVLYRGLVEKIGPFELTGSFYKTSRQLATLVTVVILVCSIYYTRANIYYIIAFILLLDD